MTVFFQKIQKTLACIFLINLVASHSKADPANIEFVGNHSTEAVMSFDGELEFTSSRTPKMSVIREKISEQLIYMIGPMRIDGTASALGGETISNVQFIRIGGGNVYHVQYHYDGRVILDNSVEGIYPIFLPIRPETIYAKSIVNGTQACTYFDQEPGKAYFFYSWYPETSGCPLKQDVDYKKVQTSFMRYPNTIKSYPEYNRMKDANGNVVISVFYSKADKGTDVGDPLKSPDQGARDFADFRSNLMSEGYVENRWDDRSIKKVAPSGETPYVATFEKKFAKANFVVHAFFGETDVTHSAESASFHYFWKRAIEQDSVILYSGHSGIGKNLHLGLIERARGFKFKMPADKYQLMLFQSCVSYSYYPRIYFGKKQSSTDLKGTRNLDILTNGTESTFGGNRYYVLMMMDVLEKWASGGTPMSYQDIAEISAPRVLFGINGDEDNPTNTKNF